MAEEKRVKLGVDIGALSQELLQVNRLVEENYQKSIKGQQDYNAILEESIGLLEKQAQLVSQLGGDLQNSVVGGSHGGGGGNNSPIHVIVDNIPLQVKMVKGAASGGGAFMGAGVGSGEMSISDIKKMLILIDKARGADSSVDNSKEAHDNETESKENDILRAIQEDLDQIWENFSEGITTPIPVLITNSSLDTNDVNGRGNGGSGDGSGDDSSGGRSVSGGKKGKGGQSNIANQAANVITQTDPNYLLAGFMAAIPYIGAGLSAVAQKLIQEAEQKDIAAYRFVGVSGGRFGPKPKEGTAYGSFTEIGLKDAEAFEKLSSYYPSNIYLSQSDLKFEKGFGVSSGTINSLLRSFREDIAREFGASVVGVDYLMGLSKEKGEGNIDWNEVRGYSEDYLRILVELNQKQLENTGETNSLINSHIIQGIASLSDKFGDPTILGRVVQGIQDGLVQAKSPQIEALQYYALSQANPGASLWEMQLMKENPFGKESAGYLSNFLEALLSTGTLEDAKFNIMHTFGLGAYPTEYLVNGIMKAKEENAKEYQDESGNFSLGKLLEHKNFGDIILDGSKTIMYKDSSGASTINKDLGVWSPISETELNSYIDKIALAGSPFKGQARVFIKAAQESGLDPRYLVAHAGLESQWGTSKIAKDKNNYFGIGAFDDSPYNSAYTFDSEFEAGIIGGAKWIAENYYNGSYKQRSLQQMRFNNGVHQYAKDPDWANKIASIMDKMPQDLSAQYLAGRKTIDSISYKTSITGNLSDALAEINTASEQATSEIQKNIASNQNRLAEWGEPLIEMTPKIMGSMDSIVSSLNILVDIATNLVSGKFDDALKTIFNVLIEGIGDAVKEGIKGLGKGFLEMGEDALKGLGKFIGISYNGIPNNTNPQIPSYNNERTYYG